MSLVACCGEALGVPGVLRAEYCGGDAAKEPFAKCCEVFVAMGELKCRRPPEGEASTAVLNDNTCGRSWCAM